MVPSTITDCQQSRTRPYARGHLKRYGKFWRACKRDLSNLLHMKCFTPICSVTTNMGKRWRARTTRDPILGYSGMTVFSKWRGRAIFRSPLPPGLHAPVRLAFQNGLSSEPDLKAKLLRFTCLLDRRHFT